MSVFVWDSVWVQASQRQRALSPTRPYLASYLGDELIRRTTLIFYEWILNGKRLHPSASRCTKYLLGACTVCKWTQEAAALCSLRDFTGIKEEHDQRAVAKNIFNSAERKDLWFKQWQNVNPKKSPCAAISANTCEFGKLDDYIFCYKDICFVDHSFSWKTCQIFVVLVYIKKCLLLKRFVISTYKRM